jgi:putative component of toxin-antitoxin plasmid stabilization module
VFYALESGRVVLLLAGSDKGEQAATIKTARKRLNDWKTRRTQ